MLIGLLLMLGIQDASVSAMSSGTLDADTHRQVLVEVADVIRDRYADPKVGQAIADTIMTYVKQGGADSSIDAEALVAHVMGVIRSMVADRHFDFSDRSAEQDDSDPSPARKRSKHGLRTARMLANQTAYFEFDGFPGDDESLTAVAKAIEEQPAMQAVIFDVRDNNGGAGDMVVLLCNHLLETDQLLYTFAGRSDAAATEVRSSAGDQYFGTAMPVYILTSENTLSAAEAFTYILQDLDRATVVGERTAGMANPSRTFTIAGRFDLTVPFLIMRYGKSGGTFAGVGVTPDIEVSADSALDTVLEKLEADG
ncbi:MAG: S41 family peptidase [Candidatus Latescibacterota bacterium]|nr:MAG: S41 family peptidase [Candidatus Latescibacterota bacterium]